MTPKTLRDELKMAKPFKSVEEEALLSIARTAALIEHAGAEAFNRSISRPRSTTFFGFSGAPATKGSAATKWGSGSSRRCPT